MTIGKVFADLIFAEKQPFYILHVCDDIKFVGINFRDTGLIRENREHLYPRNIPAIRYIDASRAIITA